MQTFCEDQNSRWNIERKCEKDNDGRLENDEENIEDDEQDNHIPELTMKEPIIAIGSLEKWKSADSKGIKAEGLKGADE